LVAVAKRTLCAVREPLVGAAVEHRRILAAVKMRHRWKRAEIWLLVPYSVHLHRRFQRIGPVNALIDRDGFFETRAVGVTKLPRKVRLRNQVVAVIDSAGVISHYDHRIARIETLLRQRRIVPRTLVDPIAEDHRSGGVRRAHAMVDRRSVKLTSAIDVLR
jgi:hypothetical protein